MRPSFASPDILRDPEEVAQGPHPKRRGLVVLRLPRPGGRFFWQWKDANSLKHRWLETIERAGVDGLHFHDLRHTVATWLLKAGVDYIVIEKLLGHRLPGTGDLYIHDWDSRVRDAVTRIAVLTEQKLREKSVPKSMKKPSRCH